MHLRLAAALCGLVAARARSGVSSRSGQDVVDSEGNHVYLAGAPGDDGTKEGLFGPYFDVPVVSAIDGSRLTTISMQLAITPDEDHHGLMYRNTEPENSGMLFLYPNEQRRVLYMRNTLIDLDAGWMSHDGTLLEVQKLNKLDETYRYSANTNVQWGLEMNVGWFAAHNVLPGQARLDMGAVAQAIQARGFDPEKYGLTVAASPVPHDSSKLIMSDAPQKDGTAVDTDPIAGSLSPDEALEIDRASDTVAKSGTANVDKYMASFLALKPHTT